MAAHREKSHGASDSVFGAVPDAADQPCIGGVFVFIESAVFAAIFV